MDTILVATTHQEGLRPVGTGGQLTIHAYEQLVRYLRRMLSEDHARLLAEPNFNPARGTVDWYTETDQDIVPLSAADPDQRQAVESRLAELRDDIQRQAGALSRSDSGGDRQLGEMLRLALEVPDDEFIYCAGSRPVLVCWGTLRDQPDPPRGVLQKFIPYTPPPAPPPSPGEAAGPTPGGPPEGVQAIGTGAAAATAEPEYVEVRRPLYWLAWLLWLLFGLLVAAILVVLLSGCGIRLPFIGTVNTGLINYCPIGAAEADPGRSPELQAELARTQVLEEELRRLELRIAVARRACERAAADPPESPAETPPDGPPATPAETPPEGPAEEPAEPPSPDEDAAIDERLDREGAQRGEVAVSLTWDSDADLDLRVTCPGGEEIYYGRRSACGGELDVDMNVPSRMSEEPVENVYWPEGAAPPGTYRVAVTNFQTRSEGDQPTPFRVRVVNGGDTAIYEGEVHERDGRHAVVEFQVP
jgi:hypothetical protein